MKDIKVNYEFVPEFITTCEKRAKDAKSYAGKLLEIVESRTLIITLSDVDDSPVLYKVRGRMCCMDSPSSYLFESDIPEWDLE